MCECTHRCRKSVILTDGVYEHASRRGAVLDYHCALAEKRVILSRLGEGVVLCRTANGGRPGGQQR